MLNDLEQCIVGVKAMRYNEKKALEYLRENGHDISRAKYYKTLGHISSETRKRAFEIAKSYLDDHVDVLDKLERIEQELYEIAEKETDQTKKAMILLKTVETMIPFITEYRDITKAVIEKVKKEVGKEEINYDISLIGG